MSDIRSPDFCNSFWGPDDRGTDVLFGRMNGAMRTTEALRGVWRERAAIEEDYAKRLENLAKKDIWRDEFGAVKEGLESVQTETKSQMTNHLRLAQDIREKIERRTTAIIQRQAKHQILQNTVERELEMKKTQEKRVEVLREKYERECLKVHSLTNPASETNPPDAEREVNHEPEQALQAVQATESEFSSRAEVLSEIVSKWEDRWKGFCDSCQEMEDERINSLKEVTWAYANAISTVCVDDDLACERVRVSLEKFWHEDEVKIMP